MPKSIVVTDAPADVQAWAEAVIQLGLEDGPDWPLPPHTEPDEVVITMADLERLIEQTFRNNGAAWSVAVMGLPPIELADGSRAGSPVTPDLVEVTGPNSGSYFHNLWHKLFD